MKKQSFYWMCTALLSYILSGCNSDSLFDLASDEPVLTKATAEQVIFEDYFDQPDGIPDTTYWSLCPHDTPDWARYLSESYDQAYVQDGKLVLVGEKIDGQYQTGGVQTLGKVDFQYGKVEVCARFTQSAQGGWPAIWMMPSQPTYPGWPDCGEIDIMEQLNHDKRIHHTIHNHYKNVLNMYLPIPAMTASYNVGEFNVYAVNWTSEALTFSVNGVVKLTYRNMHLPRESVKMQWPFNAPFYLILNQALGGEGTWPGAITDSELPAKMEIDWVKVTQYD